MFLINPSIRSTHVKLIIRYLIISFLRWPPFESMLPISVVYLPAAINIVNDPGAIAGGIAITLVVDSLTKFVSRNDLPKGNC